MNKLTTSLITFAVLCILMTNQGQAQNNNQTEHAVLAGGCFWCMEAVFQNFKGVISVKSGYSGGTSKSPTYQSVSSGTSGHAEAIEIKFDPKIISYAEIVEIFFHAHDPTTLNQQGADIGTQYRSAIFYGSPEQEKIAKEIKSKIETEKLWNDPIVTDITALTEFYPAEEYHQDYFNRNPAQPYCSIVIAPKVQKIYKLYKAKLKDR